MLQEGSASSYSTSTHLYDFFISQPYLHSHYILGILCKPSLPFFFFTPKALGILRSSKGVYLPHFSSPTHALHMYPLNLLSNHTLFSPCFFTRAFIFSLTEVFACPAFLFFFFFHFTPRITTASYAEKARPLFPLLILNKISGFLSRNQS